MSSLLEDANRIRSAHPGALIYVVGPEPALAWQAEQDGFVLGGPLGPVFGSEERARRALDLLASEGFKVRTDA